MSDKPIQKVATPDLGKSQSFRSAREAVTDSVKYASAKQQIKAQLQTTPPKKTTHQSDSLKSSLFSIISFK